ncbi:MAG: DUF749 family protein [Euryarchaeota archaeon]
MFVAKYLGRSRYSELSDDLKDFARLKASLANVDLDRNPSLFLFNVEGTSSYYVIFEEEVNSLEDVERLLKKDLGAQLSRDSREKIARELNR